MLKLLKYSYMSPLVPVGKKKMKKQGWGFISEGKIFKAKMT